MNEVYKTGLSGKLYRLLFKMNQNTCIRIQTPVGVTVETNTGENVAQGSVGAILSSVNLDSGVRQFFANSEHEVNFCGVNLGPLLFQDDIARLSLDISSAQIGNDMLECVAETKLLDFNLEKSGYIVFGKKQRRLQLLNQLEETPLTLSGGIMKNMETIKYLGDYLCGEGLAESVTATVSRRRGLVLKAGLEKTRVFLIKPNPAVFFGFYWVFGVLLGFFLGFTKFGYA